MPAPSNATEFLQLLELSNLVAGERVQQALENAGLDASQSPTLLAEALVRAQIITRFQADQLLAGRHRGFFIGKYRILDLVGSGGMGRVYLAEHAIMRRQVALKVLPKAKSAEPSALARFQREARAVASLNHPNIIQAYDIDQEGDIHYMVMEYVDGLSVQEYVKQLGPIPFPQAADYVCQACDALEHANKSGLIHRDIKPGNLLIDMTGTVKLLDLGLAVFFEEKDRDPLTLTYDENVLGTADYLAPEQALDSHNVDIRADIYSLGGTFYYMLTGGPPFPDGTIAQKLLWHQNKQPKPVRSLAPSVPVELAAILCKMMAKDPADRFQSPAKLRDALAPFARHVNQPLGDTPPPRGMSRPASSKTNVPSSTKETPPIPKEKESSKPAPVPTSSPPVGKRSARASKPRPNQSARVPAGTVADKSDPSLDASIATEGTTVTAGADESAEFLKSLADSFTSSPSSRVLPSPAADQPPPWKKAMALLEGADRKKIVMTAGGAGGAIVLLALVTFLFVGRKPTPAPVPKPVAKPALPPASQLIVAKEPKAHEFLLDEALSEVRSGQTMLLQAKGKTTWDVSNLRFGDDAIDGTGITVAGQGSDTVLSLYKNLDGPIVSIRSSRQFTLRDLVLDGEGKRGPLIEIFGARVAGVTLRNVTLRNFKGEGIRLSNVDGNANDPVRFENVVVEMNDPKGNGIVIAGGSDDPRGGRTYHVQLLRCKISGPFAAGIAIEQPINVFSLRDCDIQKGTTGILLSARDTDWRKLSLQQVQFADLNAAVAVNAIKPEAIQQIQWLGPVFSNVKTPPDLSAPAKGK